MTLSGQYSKLNECDFCWPGSWVGLSSQTRCQSCEAGKASDQRGATTQECPFLVALAVTDTSTLVQIVSQGVVFALWQG